ncbi:hypothetical protein [Streptomyces xanthochromogenes]
MTTSPDSAPLQPGSITSTRIQDGAVETGSILDALRDEDPQMIEAMILTALAHTSLNGLTDMGMNEARRFLGLYRQHVVEEASHP